MLRKLARRLHANVYSFEVLIFTEIHKALGMLQWQCKWIFDKTDDKDLQYVHILMPIDFISYNVETESIWDFSCSFV